MTTAVLASVGDTSGKSFAQETLTVMGQIWMPCIICTICMYMVFLKPFVYKWREPGLKKGNILG